jgi:hypothetical protein
MTIEVDFDDEPPPYSGIENGPTNQFWSGNCKICKLPLTSRWWLVMGARIHASVHDKCAQKYNQDLLSPNKRQDQDSLIPERFREWSLEKFKDKRGFSAAQCFDPEHQYSVLVLMGDVGRGKSRLGWQIAKQFCEIWSELHNQSRWCDYFEFSDLCSEYDQSKLLRLKNCWFAFVDDIRDVPIGRIRSSIQDAIRSRVKRQGWTLLTIDDPRFDEDLVEHVLRERAVKITISA